MDEYWLPKNRAGRCELAEQTGTDGMRLLESVFAGEAPGWLRELPAVRVLRRAWVQEFFVDGEGRLRWRDPKDRPPGGMCMASPYDVDVRYGKKDATKWDEFKVHLTETCDDDAPRILTDVTTTPATVSDDHMMKTVHARLAERDALPGEHWVDGGYVNAAALSAARREHGVDLNGPAQTNTTPQAAGAYGLDAFTIDFGQRQATWPNGVMSGGWKHGKSQQGLPVIRIGIRKSDCQHCPALRECVSSPTGVSRELTVRHRDDHEAVRQARARQQTDEWKERYEIRAGIEGTVSQAVQRPRPAQIPLPRPGQNQPPAPAHRRRDQPHPHRRTAHQHAPSPHPKQPPRSTSPRLTTGGAKQQA